MNKKIVTGFVLAGILAGCTSADGGLNNKTKGTAAGGAVGAIVGQIIGKDTKGTVIGAAIGSLAGLGWGAYRDKQEAELRKQLENSEVEVSIKGENINLSLPGGVTFGTDQTTIKSSFYGPLDSIAEVLIAYPETRLIVAGHTDSDGAASYNQDLSERRAASVRRYLINRGVPASRVSTVGYGESEPVASNNTAAGKARNRRVEIEILPIR